MKYFYAAIQFLWFVLFVAAPASANPTAQTKEPTPSTLSTSPNFKKDFKISPQVGARFSSQGAGTDSFVGVEGFVPLFQNGQQLTYLEGRLQAATDQGRLGTNALLGHRFLSSSGQAILGGYLSYDTRNTGDAMFHQFGLGFEHLSDALDFRTNVYLPIGDRSRTLSSSLIGSPRFQGNRFGVDRISLVQEALTGVDVEVGTKLANLGRGTLRGYVGAYHYSGEGVNPFTGFRTRLVARPTDSITAGVTLQTDSRFDTRLMFNVGFAFPGNGGGQPAPEPTILARLGESPERQPSIVVDQFRKSNFEIAVNPETKIPWNFEFVTLGTGTGDGTFELPAGTIAAVLPKAKAKRNESSIVYVQAGTNPGIPGFTIPDGVSVISSATSAEDSTIPTQFGPVELPNVGTGELPIVNGTIRMGNDTELSGFKVVNSSGAGIQGANLKDVYIHNNTVQNSASEGIVLRNVTGEVVIAENTVKQTGVSTAGIELKNSTGNVQALIEDNTITNTSSSAIAIDLEGTAQGTVTIQQNSLIRNQGEGIYTRAKDNSVLTSRITNNTIENAQVIPSDNPFSEGAAPYGVTRGITAFVQGTAKNTTVIENNRLTSTGIVTSSQDRSSLDATIVNNTIESQGKLDNSGITYFAFDNSEGTLKIQNNRVSGFYPSGTDPVGGIRVALYDASKANVSLIQNTVTDNDRGIDVSANNTAQLKVKIDGNTITDNRLDGILIAGSSTLDSIGTGTPNIAANLQNNTLSSNGVKPLEGGFGDLTLATFSPGAKTCFKAANNTIGVLAIADQINPLLPLVPPFNKPPVSLLSGQVASELPYNPLVNASGNGNTVTALNPLSLALWSNTTLQPGSCPVP